MRLFKLVQTAKQALSTKLNKVFDNWNKKISAFLPPRTSHYSLLDSRFRPGNCIPYAYFIFQGPRGLPSTRNGSTAGPSPARKAEESAEDVLKGHLENQIKLLLKARGLDRGSQPRSLSRESDRDR